jgi:hypothetical protein
VAIVNGNEHAGARRRSYCTCMGEGKDVVDFVRQTWNLFIHKCKNVKSSHLVWQPQFLKFDFGTTMLAEANVQMLNSINLIDPKYGAYYETRPRLQVFAS